MISSYISFFAVLLHASNHKLEYTVLIPLKVIGCNLTSDEIVKEWDALCKDGFPLILR
jgi:hypothetical protein